MLVKARYPSTISPSTAGEMTTDGIEREAVLINKLMTGSVAELSEASIQELAEMKITPAVKGFINTTRGELSKVLQKVTDASNDDKQDRDAMLASFGDLSNWLSGNESTCVPFETSAGTWG